MYQSEFNFSGEQLRDAGMQLAVDHADAVSPDWSIRAYQFVLNQFLPNHKRFLTEDIRSYAAELDFELPPSARAWGSVILRIARDGYIVKIGIKPVTNAKAHCANASWWERNDERMIEMGLIKLTA